jgi:hypothetical protein
VVILEAARPVVATAHPGSAVHFNGHLGVQVSEVESPVLQAGSR